MHVLKVWDPINPLRRFSKGASTRLVLSQVPRCCPLYHHGEIFKAIFSSLLLQVLASFLPDKYDPPSRRHHHIFSPLSMCRSFI